MYLGRGGMVKDGGSLAEPAYWRLVSEDSGRFLLSVSFSVNQWKEFAPVTGAAQKSRACRDDGGREVCTPKSRYLGYFYKFIKFSSLPAQCIKSEHGLQCVLWLCEGASSCRGITNGRVH